MPRLARLAAALVVAASGAGCALWALHTAPRLAPCPGPLAPSERLGGDWTARHSARVTGSGVDLALSLVLEKRGDRLRLVGFDALGSKRFAATQRGVEVEVERFGLPLVVPPRNVLRDLQQVHFPEAVDGPGARDADAALERGRNAEGRPTARVRRPACGYEATYVTLAWAPPEAEPAAGAP